MTLFHACCGKSRTLFFVLLTLFIGLGMPLPTAASEASDQVSARPDPPEKNQKSNTPGQPVVLDEAALRSGIAQRLRTAREAKDDRFKAFTADHVTIHGTLPVHTPEMTFFAVKLRILPPLPNARPEYITLAVDRTGTLQIGSVLDLSTGNDLMKDAMDSLQSVDVQDLPPELGKQIHSGSGPHQIIAISDPFCPHCRRGWDHIKLNLDRIHTLRLAHFPLSPASEAACLVMADAFDRNLMVFEVTDFSYTLLDKAPEPREIIAQYMELFPELATAWGLDPAAALVHLQQKHLGHIKNEQNMVQALGISSTPVFFVNQTYIRGFNEQKMTAAMP
jgi:protein-disulfide isomerase